MFRHRAHYISLLIFFFFFFKIARPYSVGDRVTCSGVCLDSSGNPETLLVRRINVLYTIFQRINSREIAVSNAKLYSLDIENFRRSPPAVFRIDLSVSNKTTASQLETLRRRINSYLEKLPIDWKPTCTMRISGIRDQSISLLLFINSHHRWQDAPLLWRAVFFFYIFLAGTMRENNIIFHAADQNIRVHLESQSQQHGQNIQNLVSKHA